MQHLFSISNPDVAGKNFYNSRRIQDYVEKKNTLRAQLGKS